MKEIIINLIQKAIDEQDYDLLRMVSQLIWKLSTTYNAPSNWRNIGTELEKIYKDDIWVYDGLDLIDYTDETE